jgi:hypothetical protein
VQLRATYDGADDPFEGDRALLLRGLPAGARVTKATAAVTPVSNDATTPFLEQIALPDDAPASWGATTVRDTGKIQIDLHTRRKLAAVEATGTKATFLVDLGGVLVSLDSTTGAMIPNGTPAAISLTPSPAPLPQVEATGLRLMATDLNATAIDVVSPPTNLTLRLGTLGPFWTRIGELTASETSLDFAPVLQAFLAGAEVKDGAYTIPIVVHSDRIARLRVELDVEFLLQASLLPDGVPSISLAFDAGTVTKGPGSLSVTLPPNARAVAEGSSAHVRGAFEESRVAAGAPLGVVSAAASVPVSGQATQAQPIATTERRRVAGLDLLLKADEGGATLSATILPDADGKPFGDPLLPAPAQFVLPRATAGPVWTSAALSPEFQLEAGRRYWLVLRALTGTAQWAVDAAPAGATPLQSSADGGFSWRDGVVPAQAGALVALFRLRETPTRFRMPIELRMGGAREDLQTYEPLGRVDFAVSGDKLAGLVNGGLASAPRETCSAQNHLANPDFAQWTEATPETPVDWELTSGTVGRNERGDPGVVLGFGATTDTSSLSQVVPIGSGCRYLFELDSVTAVNAAAEVIWLRGDCHEARTDSIDLSNVKRRAQVRTVLQPPADAVQAEVRLQTRPQSQLMVRRVVMAATRELLANPDLRDTQPGEPISGWTTTTDATPAAGSRAFGARPRGNATELENPTDGTVTLTQQVALTPGVRFSLVFDGEARAAPQGMALELRWLNDMALPDAPDAALALDKNTFSPQLLAGTVPDGVSKAELRLVLPPTSDIVLRRVSMQTERATTTSVDVLAHGPGDLRVANAALVYDIDEAEPPPVPATGLCTPTPPGRKPGEPAHCDYCPCCGCSQRLSDAVPAVTPGGRPALAGRCAECGTERVHLGGAGPVVEPAALSGRRPVVVQLASPATMEPVESLPRIDGIGRARARALVAAGIDSIERLAAEHPDTLRSVLRGGLSDSGIREILGEARRLAAEE